MYTRLFFVFFFPRLDYRCVFKGKLSSYQGVLVGSRRGILFVVSPHCSTESLCTESVGLFFSFLSCGASSLLTDFLDRVYIFFYPYTKCCRTRRFFFLLGSFFSFSFFVLLFPGRRCSSTPATYLLPARAHCIGGLFWGRSECIHCV